jgi:hypothetical protein
MTGSYLQPATHISILIYIGRHTVKRAIIIVICLTLSFISCTTQEKPKESAGLFPVRQNKQSGYIDRTGTYVWNAAIDETLQSRWC